jgi:hypothetical protein
MIRFGFFAASTTMFFLRIVGNPMKMRLEPINPVHSQTVALLSGPLELFAITDTQPLFTCADLLAAKRMDQ